MHLLHGCSTMLLVGHDTAREEKCSIYDFSIMTKPDVHRDRTALMCALLLDVHQLNCPDK